MFLPLVTSWDVYFVSVTPESEITENISFVSFGELMERFILSLAGLG